MRGIQKVAVVAGATVVFVFVGGGSALGRASTGPGGSGSAERGAAQSAEVQHGQAASSVPRSHEPGTQP